MRNIEFIDEKVIFLPNRFLMILNLPDYNFERERDISKRIYRFRISLKTGPYKSMYSFEPKSKFSWKKKWYNSYSFYTNHIIDYNFWTEDISNRITDLESVWP